MPAKKRSLTFVRPCSLAALALAAVLVALPVVGQAASAADRDRQDNVFGTTREGMEMGRDPDTGDVFMRVAPAEQPPPPAYASPPIEVRPEIVIPMPAGKNDGQ